MGRSILAGHQNAEELIAHLARRDNPHGITAAQAGADPAGSAAGVQNSLNWHAGRMDNPHGVTAAQIGAQDAATAINTGNVANYAIVPGALTAYLASVGGIRAEAVEYRGSNMVNQTLTFSFPPKFVIVSERVSEGVVNGREWANLNTAGSLFINCIAKTGVAVIYEGPNNAVVDCPNSGDLTPVVRTYKIALSGNSVSFSGNGYSSSFYNSRFLYVATAFG